MKLEVAKKTKLPHLHLIKHSNDKSNPPIGFYHP